MASGQSAGPTALSWRADLVASPLLNVNSTPAEGSNKMDDLAAIFSTAIPLHLWAVVAIAGLAFVFGQVAGSVILWNVLAKSGWINKQSGELSE